MFQTVVVYITLTVVMLFLSLVSSQKRNMWPIIMLLITYAFIFGSRWGVGMDYFSYQTIYSITQSSGELPSNIENNWEPGYSFITKWFANAGLHYSIYFAFIAFVQLSFFYFRLRKDYYIFPFLSFTFMMGCTWLSFNNGLRQVIAVGIFFYSLYYIVDRKWIKYVLCIILASLFHKSALILLAIPFLPVKSENFIKTGYQWLLLCLSLAMVIVGTKFNIFEHLNFIIKALGYDYYDGSTYAEYSDVSVGLGFIIALVINCINIYYGLYEKKFINNRYYPIIYNLYFIGVILGYMFLGVQLVGRINYYFIMLNFVVSAFTLYFLIKKNKQVQALILSGLYLSTFVAVMSKMEINTALYNFWWDI